MKFSLVKKFKQDQSGMTYVEMIVVVLIISTMTTAMFLGRGALDSTQKTIMSTQKLASDLRKMQSFTLNLRENKGEFPIGGWSLYINADADNSVYKLFGDVSEDREFSDDEQYLSDFKLPSGIYVEKMVLNPDVTPDKTTDMLTVVFEPPDPICYICDVTPTFDPVTDCDYDEVEITLSNDSGTVKRIIEINSYGLVDVKNN